MEISQQDLAAAFSAAMAPLVEQVSSLASSVAALQEGHAGDNQRPPATPQDFAKLTPVTRGGLVESTDDTVREARRSTGHMLNFEHNVLMHYIKFGGRGLYRDCHEFCSTLPHAAKVALVLDAQHEDVREAQQMSADLLKFWGDNAAPLA